MFYMLNPKATLHDHGDCETVATPYEICLNHGQNSSLGKNLYQNVPLPIPRREVGTQRTRKLKVLKANFLSFGSLLR